MADEFTETESDENYESDFSEEDNAEENDIQGDATEEELLFSLTKEEEVIEDENSDDETDNETFKIPEELLRKLAREKNKDNFNKLKANKTKCLTLQKIVNGKGHWLVAEAHVDLAQTYLNGKHFPQQTLKHCSLARDILLGAEKDNTDSQYLLQKLYLTMGRANLQLNKNKAAENTLQKAKLIADSNTSAIEKYLQIKVQILSSLGRAQCKLGQYGQAVECVENVMDIVSRMKGDQRIQKANLYKHIVDFELMNSRHFNTSSALDAGLKALEIFKDVDKTSKDVADTCLLMSRIECNKEIADYINAELYINEAIDIYRLDESAHGEVLLNAKKMLAKLNLQQSRYKEALEMLNGCVEEYELTYGDMSLQCADLYELIGSVQFELKNLAQAIVYFSKAHEIFAGKRVHRKRQEKLNEIISIIRKSSRDDNLKTANEKLNERPRFA